MTLERSHAAVQGALATHCAEGRIRHWLPPSFNGRTYRVDLHDYGWWEGTLREAHALVVGLRDGFLAERERSVRQQAWVGEFHRSQRLGANDEG